TTIMTGFPGETAESFGKVLDFVSDVEFDRLGAFVYSPEEGTRAATLSGKVPKKTAESRCNRLMRLQSEISQERGELFVGRELDVLIEEVDDEAGESWGRSFRDAPEVDGLVGINESKRIKAGEIKRVVIYDSDENDLFAEVKK
ncbi:MAG: 30S ribosomal protein S12 methylthiotransferase RimO, partial [Synergistaceae bacterium]|nr:30S ribosomal protein S12 methylthiotransferase RimO [Synergistaceae bacterium]